MGDGPYFAPLPARVIGDRRLSALELRVLACIAAHDRMSLSGKGKAGCWAGNATLATEAGCDYTRLSAAITHLGQLGYVERSVHPVNKRLRIHRVVYDVAADRAAIGPDALRNGKLSDDATVCETANHSGSIVCRDGGIVCRHNSQAIGSKGEPVTKRLGETLERYSENRKIDPAEAAPSERRVENAALLAMIERAWKGGKITDENTVREVVRELERIEDEHHVTDSEYGRAQRLLEDIRPEHWRPS